MATPQFPEVFSSDPDMLLNDLARLSSELRRQHQGLSEAYERRVSIESRLFSDGDAHAHFDSAIKVAPNDEQTLNVMLPSPQRKNAGRTVPIIRTRTTGIVFVYAPGSLVNGRRRVLLLSSIGVNYFLFDGENYYGDKQHGVPTDEVAT